MSTSHHYLKSFSAFHLLSLLGTFSLLSFAVNTLTMLPGQWGNPKFSFFFLFFFFYFVTFPQAQLS